MSLIAYYTSLLGNISPGLAGIICLASSTLLILIGWVVRTRILTPYRHLPSPPGLSLKHNHSSLTYSTPFGQKWGDWFKTYGNTIVVRVAPYHREEILTIDPGFVRYVHANVNDFEGSPRLGRAMVDMGIHGAISCAKGEKRQKIRAVFERSCSLAAMRGYFPRFINLAYKARDKIMEELESDTEKRSGKKPINPSTHAVGYQMGIVSTVLFGFNEEDIAKGRSTEVRDTIMAFHKARSELKWWDTKSLFRTPRYRRYNRSRDQLAVVGKKLLRDKQEKITRAFGQDLKSDDILEAGDDIISTWCRLNMSKDIPASQKISDQDLADNVPIAMAATLDVSRMMIYEIIHRLASHRDIQDKLRKEFSALPEEPSLDDLAKVAYLDAFLDELVRIDNAYTTIERTCTRTCVVPLHDPITLSNGQTVNSITVHKGTDVSIPIWNLSADERLYGSDATEFRPERHLDGSTKGAEGGTAIHATWGSSAGFSGGQRGCPVYQYPLAFMRAFIFVMVRSFEISEPTDQDVKIWVSSSAERREHRVNNKPVTWIPTIFKPISQDV
ncbi:cytochrome P450 [Kockovaella imperatae]|uniref:Cytochrome P450 n=1 Tax=Kockovaella imperatae TaxID=4999 RepID=A0A1Y1UJB5_9TREE|nr:cytochrome P450 [Kockovaella imperatae]ORX37566.1 cytochrome P450 [Kockovaella imperatae]